MAGQPFVLKTTPPRTHRLALARPRLADFRQAAESCSAILVEAPRGFGKTTLLTQWRRSWLEQGAIVAWVTLDTLDAPERFNQALIFAMRVASGRSVFDTLMAETRARPSTDYEALTATLSEIANLATPTAVILDDGERLPAETVEHSLTYLMLNAPANLQIIIGSRTPLPLPTAELVARDGLRRLTTQDLRLSLDESVAILRSRFGPRLTLDNYVRLHDMTEGWPIGLQLAAAVVERADDPARAVEALSGRQDDIERYFVESLFDRLPDPQRQFLVRASILDYLTPELCEHLTECGSAATFMDQLMSDTPIMIVAEMRGWVRLHPLARDFLQSRFEALPEAEQRRLHLRAADWLMKSGYLHEAAQHALAAGDEARARNLAERSIWDLAKHGRLGEAHQWLRRLPQVVSEGDLPLRISVVWVMALGDRPREALKLAEQMAAEPGHDRQSQFLIALVYACAAAFSDKPGLMLTAMQPWLESPGDLSEPVYAAAYANTLVAMALFRSDFAEMRRIVASTPSYQHASIDMAPVLGHVLSAAGHIYEGNALKAESSLQTLILEAERAMGRRSTPASLLASPMAAALLEQGREDAAQAMLANRLDVIERAALADPILIAYRTLAYLEWRRGDVRRALEVFDRLQAMGAERGIPRMVMRGLAEQVRIHALAARPETARERLTALEAMRSAFRREEFLPFLPLFDLTVAIARAYSALASNDIEAANESLKRADVMSAKYGRGRDAIVIKALRAVAAREHGYADRAQTLIREAAGLADLGGLWCILADTHPRAAALLEDQAAPPSTVVQRSAPATVARTIRAEAVQGGMLTAKEATILGLLSANMSNKLIARTMDISDETVKWHLKNLFSKLNAGTRKHAVDRARLLGLITA